MLDSPVDMTGNSTGSPPASQTPRLTCSAMVRRCALHGVSSDQVLQMPTTGRPSNTSAGRPWLRIQLRWMKPSLSCLPNQAAERYVRVESNLRQFLHRNHAPAPEAAVDPARRLLVGIVHLNRDHAVVGAAGGV